MQIRIDEEICYHARSWKTMNSHIGRECGISKAMGINCGNCPSRRLEFLQQSDHRRDSQSQLKCEETSGRCMVEGRAIDKVFAWDFKP
ncbi:unnamed protein product [Symbiodinium natans]|uniref:Uncharacterized protein n=1 Tax=Symbiodinium natans TaxID=878477 RepID=A0A812LIA8_9DINO|nr:unnamed protein product [Symbiodinium natans]